AMSTTPSTSAETGLEAGLLLLSTLLMKWPTFTTACSGEDRCMVMTNAHRLNLEVRQSCRSECAERSCRARTQGRARKQDGYAARFCSRYSFMNESMSPSSTWSTFEVSCLVRTSLTNRYGCRT